MLIQWPVKVDVISSLMPPIHHVLLSVSHRQWSISLHKSGNHLDRAILILMGGRGVMEWSTAGAKQAAKTLTYRIEWLDSVFARATKHWCFFIILGTFALVYTTMRKINLPRLWL